MQAFFLESRTGQRFALYHEPAEPVRGIVVAIHAFGEEMNKSRRMMGLGARALAAAGYAVLQTDLHGCGDSSGDLVDADWDDWIQDVLQARDWLAQRHDAAPQWLWGMRAGCLVAAEVARRTGTRLNFIFWQPQSSGRQALQQFLRLKMASQMQQGVPKGSTAALQRELAAGSAVEVAGYLLGSGIAQGLAAASLLPTPPAARLCWFEVTTREPAQLLASTEPVIEAWRQGGCEVQTRVVAGPPFWQTLEIEDAPSLVTATVSVLGSAHGAAP